MGGALDLFGDEGETLGSGALGLREILDLGDWMSG